jgi:predicted ribosome quality control (RQC) complex YloA/Tae2 family protein
MPKTDFERTQEIEKEFICNKTKMRTVEIDDYTVIIGENAKENDELVKESAPNDIWLHLENMSSAHIVIKTNDKEPPKRVINMAASLFARYSPKKVTGRYNVIWTEIKNVKTTTTAGCVVPKKMRKIKC